MLGRLSELAASTGGHLHGADVKYDGIGTDTRRDMSGQAYVALVGERFDGNDYVAAAAEAGAVGAVVSRLSDTEVAQIVVDDTLLALQKASGEWRKRYRIPVLGITGSNGKTTTKEMLATILRQRAPTLATEGNLNNHIGVPLTLARLRDEHAYAVIEMGANHPGEIALLAGISRPTIGLVTHAGDAHLEGFGSREGVARAKGEMFKALDAEGVAVINADDEYADLWRDFAAGRRQVCFGMDTGADVTAKSAQIVVNDTRGGWEFELDICGQGVAVRLPLLGKHNLMNALAATAAAHCAGATPAEIASGLAGMQPVPGRLCALPGVGGLRLIDDTYNANPSSLQAALDVLRGIPQKSWLALGNMAELGDDAAAVHQRMGGLIRAAGVERLLVCGDLAAEAAASFGAGSEVFADHASLSAAVREAADESVCLLVKGSRSAGMEAVVEALTADGGAAC